MNTSFVTNIILVICAICMGVIVVLLFFVADDWYAKRENVKAVVLLKKNSYEDKKATIPQSVVFSKQKDSIDTAQNYWYQLKVSTADDTLLLKAEKEFYLSNQVGDTILLTKSVGYFTKKVFYTISF
jgi:hypothetical protein